MSQERLTEKAKQYFKQKKRKKGGATFMPKCVERDLIGYHTGDLTVIAKAEDKIYDSKRKYRRRQWLCQCSCGKTTVEPECLLLSGHVKSCGHLKHDAMVKAAKTRYKDLSGLIIKNVKVIKRAEDHISDSGRKYIMYEVECLLCGDHVVVRADNLRSGNVSTCGKCGPNALKDLTGKTFGEFTVEGRVPDIVYPSGSKKIMWKCICSCGQHCVVDGQELRNGHRTDCGYTGCSLAEKEIRTLLNQYKVEYVPEYSFDDLLSSENRPLRFDFAIFLDGKLICLIEYQGIQHYWKYQFGYIQRQFTDAMKKQYCKANNISLFEIKYTENIQEKLIEILQANSVPISA